jgi:hypothetical protein
MNDNGRTNYSVSLDTSELEASAKKVINTFKTMGNDIEKEESGLTMLLIALEENRLWVSL